MTKIVRMVSFAPVGGTIALIVLSLFPGRSAAQGGLTDSLLYSWQKAFFAERDNDPDAIMSSYQEVLNHIGALPPHLQAWFQANANFGIARANAMIGDRQLTLQYLDSALKYHFWNIDMFRLMPSFKLLFGQRWLDSITASIVATRDSASKYWPQQPIIIIKPTHPVEGKHYPLIVALHGGNGSYELFSRRLCELPDTLGVVVAAIPGLLRISEVSNAWGNNMKECVQRVNSALDVLVHNPLVDSSDISFLGFSQGSEVSYAYCTEHPERVRGVIAFSGFAPEVLQDSDIDADLKRVAARHDKVIAISGQEDAPEFLQSTKALEHKAKADGVQFVFKLEPDMPHGLPLNTTGYIKRVWHELHGEKTSLR